MTTQWLTMTYGLLACFGGGALAFTGIAEAAGIAGRARKVGAGIAALLLVAGIAALASALGHPASVMSMATNAAKGSPKSIEFVCALLCLADAAAYLAVSLRSASETPARVLGIAGIVLGVAMGAASGCSSAVGRDAYAFILPVAWLGNGLAFGGSLLATLAALLGDAGVSALERKDAVYRLSLYTLIALAVQAVGFVGVGVVGAFAVQPVLFWGGALAVGTVASAVFLLLVRRACAFAGAALLGCAVGGTCLRIAVTMLGTGGLDLMASAAQRIAL